MVQLRLFGTVHVEDAEGARDDLDEFADGVDALFIEEPVSREGSFWKLLLRNPGTILGVIVYGFIKFLFQVFRSDAKQSLERSLAEWSSEKTAAPIHPVDINRAQAMADVKWRITLLSWPSAAFTIITAILAGLYLTNQMFGDVFLFTLFTLVFALLPFHFTVTSLDNIRNQHMLDTTLQIAEEEGYEDVCLIAGDDHRERISKLADERGIEVADERKRDTTKAMLGKESEHQSRI